MKLGNIYIIVGFGLLLTSCGTTNFLIKKNSYTASASSNSVTKPTFVENYVPPTNSESENEIIVEQEQTSVVPEAEILISEPTYEVVTVPYSLSNEIVDLAKENIGVRYRTGGTTTAGMDCSGLVYATFQKKDLLLPRTSIAMSNQGIKITKDQAQPGDLIFFRTNGRKYINHVGIITDINNGIKFIHASIHGGVMISSLEEDYYGRAFVQINRVIE